MSGPAGNGRRRRVASVVLAIGGAFFVLVGGLFLYASRTVFDSDQFAERAATALHEERVRGPLAEALVDQLIENANPDLINARPVLITGVQGLLDTQAFRDAFQSAVQRAHRTVFTREGDRLVLNLADATTIAIEAVRAVSPEVAKQIPDDIEPTLDELVSSDFAIELAQVAEDTRGNGVFMPLIGLLLLAGSVVTDRDRRRGLLTVSMALAIAAGLGLALLVVGRALALGALDAETSDAAAAVWDVYLGDLFTSLLAALGFTLAITAAITTRRRIDPAEPLRWLGARAARAPASGWAQALRALVVLALGVLIVLNPEAFTHLLAVLVGAYAAFYGISELVMLIAPPPAPGVRPERVPLRRRVRVRPLIAAGVVLVAGVTLVVVVSGGEEERDRTRDPESIESCNGSPQLCDRFISEVAFPSVHNAMSSAEEDFLVPNNRKGIGDQLEAGVRGLLIDAHWGRASEDSDVVVTDLEAEGGKGKAREEAIEATSEEFVAAAERIVQRQALGQAGGGERGVYFCHVFCELGATPAVELFAEVREFLDQNRDEVLILFIEDYVPPKEIERAVTESGLIDYVYTPRRDQPLPTLRQMVASDERALVMAENEGGGEEIPWYVDGFDYAQETPYTFKSEPELEAKASCEENRGDSHNPLLQLNHWIEKMPRSPKTAARVNAYRFLLDRAERCRRERDLLPNLIAVDFWDEGDLFDVADTLNGVAGRTRPR